MNSTIHPFRFLLIEDNFGDFFLIEEYLSEHFKNQDLVHVSTFLEAKSVLDQEKVFDVILLDRLNFKPCSNCCCTRLSALAIAGELPALGWSKHPRCTSAHQSKRQMYHRPYQYGWTMVEIPWTFR